MSLQPDDFSRSFAQAWGNRDAATLVSMLAEDADMLTLTGAWVEGHKEIKATIEGEMNGAFARSRLVTGRGKLRPLGAGAAVLHQRFVLSGLVDVEGRDMGRVAALLMAVLVARADGWRAVSLQFTATEG